MSDDDHDALTIEVSIPASLRAAVAEKLALAAEERVGERLAEGDPTLWAPPGTPEVANRLGWLTIAERMLDQVESLEAFAKQVRDDGLADVVLLGMGGSSLAPEVLRRSFGSAPGCPRLHVLDSTDAARIRSVEQTIDVERTLFLVSSKSGGTIEPLSLFAHFWSLEPEGSHFAAITDPGSGLEQLAREHGFRRTFAGDPDIGGRYSALSAFGIVPAALIGVDIGALLHGADTAWQTRAEDAPAGVWLGAALSALAQAGRDKLTFVISDPSLASLGLWLEQLFAESTGKHGTGILPVADEPVGNPDVYGEDRVFLHLTGAREAGPSRPTSSIPHPGDADAGGTGSGRPDVHNSDLFARVRALARGHPLITIPTHGPADLGRVFMLAELAVAVAGWGLRINPFDQPNVQQAKDATNRVLAEYETRHDRAEIGRPVGADATGPSPTDDDALRALLAGAAPPAYVAIMGYVEPSDAFDEAMAELRTTIRAAGRATTTFGYGPRFLHSTGQFHKGGPKTGRFLQLIHDGPLDVEIPGASYTFTTLKNAQATGDLNTLRELGLPAARVRLAGEDPVAALRDLTTRIKKMLS
ncbi:MAG TPA: hypothetical protein VGG98_07745 [Solirubrobacteraceae bacterium]